MIVLKTILRIILVLITIMYVVLTVIDLSSSERLYSSIPIYVFAFVQIPVVGVLTFISTYRRLHHQSVMSFFRSEFWLLFASTVALGVYFGSTLMVR